MSNVAAELSYNESDPVNLPTRTAIRKSVIQSNGCRDSNSASIITPKMIVKSKIQSVNSLN